MEDYKRLRPANVAYVVPPMGLFLDRPAAVDLLAVLRRSAPDTIVAQSSPPRARPLRADGRRVASEFLMELPGVVGVVDALEAFREAAASPSRS
jgi:hypothetical protein